MLLVGDGGFLGELCGLLLLLLLGELERLLLLGFGGLGELMGQLMGLLVVAGSLTGWVMVLLVGASFQGKLRGLLLLLLLGELERLFVSGKLLGQLMGLLVGAGSLTGLVMVLLVGADSQGKLHGLLLLLLLCELECLLILGKLIWQLMGLLAGAGFLTL